MLLEKLWYQERVVLWPLVPLSLLFSVIVNVRKKFYKFGIFRRKKFSIPVIVIGNLTVGGTGKTPLVLHIAKLLKKNGFNPGIISSGYKGNLQKPTLVSQKSDPEIVGDEALVLAQYSDCPIFVYKNRVKALTELLKTHNIDIVISDDGLQHYALEREVEVVVIDGTRRFGNGYCLPAGPLREPKARLKEANLVIVNGGTPKAGEYDMKYYPDLLYNAVNPEHRQSLAWFKDKEVHAVTGIGNPNQFFKLLQDHRVKLKPHPYPDHHFFKSKEIQFNDKLPVIMTEKDFVKCRPFLNELHWVLPIKPRVNAMFDEKLLNLVKELSHG